MCCDVTLRGQSSRLQVGWCWCWLAKSHVAGQLGCPHGSSCNVHKEKVQTANKQAQSCWSYTHLNAPLTCLTAPAGALVCCDLSRGSRAAAAANTVFSFLTGTVVEQDCLTQVVDETVICSMMLPSAALMGAHADSSATEMCGRTVRCRHHGPQLHQTHFVLYPHENGLGQHGDGMVS